MRVTQIDAFTAEAFAGNPAAVCLLESFPQDLRMQQLAREMNLSETAFLTPRSENEFDLRWFTPAVEVDLCGHATLASAHALYEQRLIDADSEVSFATRGGRLTARRRGEWIEMDFPAQPPVASEAPADLIDALGAEPTWIGQNGSDWLIEVQSERQVRALAPDLKRLAVLDARGFIVTAISSASEHDFISRFFAPAVGVDEDPVTGSAHCCLGPHWARRLEKSDLVGYQASARGGVVRVASRGDRVLLAGQAVTVLHAELAVEWP